MTKPLISFTGVGIHSGKKTSVRILPGKKPGIFFKRVDLKNSPLIPALWDNVPFTGLMSTTIGTSPNWVQTIEHFMAALFVSGINNIVVEIDGPEFPIMDGGAKQFMELFKKADWSEQKPKKIIVKREVIVTRQEIIKQLPFLKRAALWIYGLKTRRKEDGFVKLSPDDRGLVLDITLDYPDKVIGHQRYEYIFDGTPRSRKKFESDISKSRTFGRFWEQKYLKKRGMGQGATENNVIVLMSKKDWEEIDDKKLLKNKGAETLTALHSTDEFVRHKLIDAIGDLALSGGMIKGKLESFKGSHAMNNLALRKLFSNPDNYDIV